MPEINQERVRETTTSTGTGAITVTGAVANHRTFSSVCSPGDVIRYNIVDSVNSAWESGVGLYSAANTITRLSVDASSNANALVSFASGTKEVFISEPAFGNERYPTILPKLNLAWANGEFLDPQFTFTRNSIATRVNSSGLLETVAAGVPRFEYDPFTLQPLGLKIEETRTNLLTYSNNWINWTRVNISTDITNSKILGGSTLTYFARQSTAASCYMYSPASLSLTATTTYTAQAKCSLGTLGNRFALRIIGAYPNRIDAVFDLSAGTVLNSSVGGTWTTPSATITKIGTNTYLVTATGVCGTTETCGVQFGPTDSTMSFSGWEGASTVLSDCYAGEVQVEAFAFKTSYIPSTDTFTSRATVGTYYGSDGLLKTAAINAARMQYNPSNLAAQPYLFLEPAATNEAKYSQDFSQAAWTKVAVSVGATLAAPDGTNTAQFITEDSTLSNHGLTPAAPPGANLVTWTFSFFARPNTRTIVDGWIDNGAGTGVTCKFDLGLQTTTFTRTGVANFANLKSSIIPLSNGWFRCIMTATNTVAPTGTLGQFRIYLNNGAASNDGFGSVSYTGDGVSGMYIWGAQMEQSQYATSYIPTTTVAVTRATDVASSATTQRQADVILSRSSTFSNWISVNTGTFVANYIGGLDSTQSGYGRIIGYDNANNVTILASNGNTSSVGMWNGVATNNLNSIVGAAMWTTGGIAGMSYSIESRNISVNGVNPQADSVRIGNLTAIAFGTNVYSPSSNMLNGTIKSIHYWNQDLKNNLQQLTTP